MYMFLGFNLEHPFFKDVRVRRAISMDNQVDGRATMRFTVEVRDATQLYQLIEAIRVLPPIFEVVRDTEVDAS